MGLVPPSPQPFPGQTGGSLPEHSPIFYWVASTQEKGFRDRLGAQGLRSKDPPGTVPCFHFHCFVASCSETCPQSHSQQPPLTPAS